MIASIIVIGLLVIAAIYWLFMSSYSQMFGHFPYRAHTTQNVVALTFDDGPNEPYTSQLANLLKKEQVKATFFEVGECVQSYPKVTKRLFADGHVIANHSLSHRFGKYFKQPGFRQEIEATQDLIEKTIGKRPALFRPPWLVRQPLLLRAANQLGLTPVSGIFCHPREPWQPAASQIAQHTLKRVKPGTIIIFHDGYDATGGDRSQTVAAVGLVIRELKTRGYSFVTVSELLGVNAYQE